MVNRNGTHSNLFAIKIIFHLPKKEGVGVKFMIHFFHQINGLNILFQLNRALLLYLNAGVLPHADK